MVTAILPTMIAPKDHKDGATAKSISPSDVHDVAPSISSELTITPNRLQSQSSLHKSSTAPSSSRLAGIVGLFTGCGALLALGLLLRLPELIQRAGVKAGQSLADSYYIVGTLSLVLSLVCFVGLRHLNGEDGKDWRAFVHGRPKDQTPSSRKALNGLTSLIESIKLGFISPLLGLGYLGGFVARASSVGISLFIPLFVNAHYISSGLCDEAAHNPQAIKESCRGAYVLAAELTGISQLVALLSAPVFGYLADRYRRYNLPLLLAALVGVLGYVGLAIIKSPVGSGEGGNLWVFFIMGLLGISQIGAIVCSLGLLGRCVLELEDGRHDNNTTRPEVDDASTNHATDHPDHEASGDCNEDAPLLSSKPRSSNHLRGSIAGVYSLAGGIGILILTKVGGLLFDKVSQVAPFYVLASFNMLLLITTLVQGVFHAWYGS